MEFLIVLLTLMTVGLIFSTLINIFFYLKLASFLTAFDRLVRTNEELITFVQSLAESISDAREVIETKAQTMGLKGPSHDQE